LCPRACLQYHVCVAQEDPVGSQVRVAQLSEVRLTIEARRLYNLGIGLTEAYLIASVLCATY
jgi:hypothetical protein